MKTQVVTREFVPKKPVEEPRMYFAGPVKGCRFIRFIRPVIQTPTFKVVYGEERYAIFDRATGRTLEGAGPEGAPNGKTAARRAETERHSTMSPEEIRAEKRAARAKRRREAQKLRDRKQLEWRAKAPPKRRRLSAKQQRKSKTAA